MELVLPAWLPLSVYAWIIQQLFFHAAGLAFEWCDRKGAISHLKVREIDRISYRQMLPQVLCNQCFILLPSMMLAQATGYCFVGSAHLHPLSFLLALPAMAIGHDVVQYLAHRYLLHNPNLRLMRMLQHSLHHSTGASRGISACYMAPADFFLEIVLPYLVPLALVGGGGTDVLFHSLVAGSGAIGGVYEHSGYDGSLLFTPTPTAIHGKDVFADWMSGLFPVLHGLLDNRAHGEHHSRANVSFSDGFGSPGICDTLLGTRWDLVASRRAAAEQEWQAQQARHMSAT
ncbi:sterol desaturase family protein [Aspergillus clavatus NRRL 1]|uniref:Fatty acid hydroxylase domain-containing protein n=1 Tax=Aspergillus clavatus (strain ATCC 1007 / CBS 513.65 / DSM 816 / NCTC 3887 / NRRL 1 / QM 1276 / 107) TaxID=344612 RepID=A1CN37_ASPCL|nr:uncharacterized protein ACLA_099180 [Aspergillus clavatus NRRL 1]EAW08974.1 conserved hypothetical protein [Aspergillus clavatus NRRL 1]